jgi:GntR family transcriptional regulator
LTEEPFGRNVILYGQDDDRHRGTAGLVAALPTARIDRSSPVPLYFQLRELLGAEIASGRWAPGDRLVSEPDLCRHFDVSRTTLRQALGSLEADGLIRRDKGRGTFVAEPRSSSWLLQSSHGFFDEASRDGRKVTSRVLRVEVARLPAWACHALGLVEGEHGVSLERVRWVDDRLVMYVETHLPERFGDVVLSSDLANGSLYRTLEERLGCVVASGRRVVAATTAERELAELLQVDVGAPLLYVESVSFDATGAPFESYRAWHRADRTKIEVQVLAHDVVRRAGLEPAGMRLKGAAR